MTEPEWLACDEPQTLLEFVNSRMSARKCRLLAAAICRHVLPLTRESCCQRAVEVAERFADGVASLEEMLAVSEQVADAYVNFPNPAPVNTDPPLSFKLESIAIQSTMFATRDTNDYLGACCRCTYLATLRWSLLRAEPGDYCTLVRWQTSLIRDTVGNPFRPMTADPRWLTSTVVALAEAVYQDRAFDRLPVLADALEDAGSDNADILNHFRGPGPHFRGVWTC
jgi:hypothetical protein